MDPTNLNTNPPAAITPHRNGVSPILSAILVLIFIVGAAASVLLYIQNQSLQSQLIQLTQAPTPTPTTAPSPTTSAVVPTQPTTSKPGEFTYPDPYFSFRYPVNFNTKCCTAAGPAQTGAKLLISGAAPSTVAPGTDQPFDGFSLYLHPTQLNFTDYLEAEKKALVQLYRDFTGNEPTQPGTQTSVTIGGQPAVSLVNFSWDTIERIYYPINSTNVLVLAKSEAKKDSFDTAFTEILASFIFSQK